MTPEFQFAMPSSTDEETLFWAIGLTLLSCSSYLFFSSYSNFDKWLSLPHLDLLWESNDKYEGTVYESRSKSQNYGRANVSALAILCPWIFTLIFKYVILDYPDLMDPWTHPFFSLAVISLIATLSWFKMIFWDGTSRHHHRVLSILWMDFMPWLIFICSRFGKFGVAQHKQYQNYFFMIDIAVSGIFHPYTGYLLHLPYTHTMCSSFSMLYVQLSDKFYLVQDRREYLHHILLSVSFFIVCALLAYMLWKSRYTSWARVEGAPLATSPSAPSKSKTKRHRYISILESMNTLFFLSPLFLPPSSMHSLLSSSTGFFTWVGHACIASIVICGRWDVFNTIECFLIKQFNPEITPQRIHEVHTHHTPTLLILVCVFQALLFDIPLFLCSSFFAVLKLLSFLAAWREVDETSMLSTFFMGVYQVSDIVRMILMFRLDAGDVHAMILFAKRSLPWYVTMSGMFCVETFMSLWIHHRGRFSFLEFAFRYALLSVFWWKCFSQDDESPGAELVLHPLIGLFICSMYTLWTRRITHLVAPAIRSHEHKVRKVVCDHTLYTLSLPLLLVSRLFRLQPPTWSLLPILAFLTPFIPKYDARFDSWLSLSDFEIANHGMYDRRNAKVYWLGIIEHEKTLRKAYADDACVFKVTTPILGIASIVLRLFNESSAICLCMETLFVVSWILCTTKFILSNYNYLMDIFNGMFSLWGAVILMTREGNQVHGFMLSPILIVALLILILDPIVFTWYTSSITRCFMRSCILYANLFSFFMHVGGCNLEGDAIYCTEYPVVPQAAGVCLMLVICSGCMSAVSFLGQYQDHLAEVHKAEMSKQQIYEVKQVAQMRLRNQLRLAFPNFDLISTDTRLRFQKATQALPIELAELLREDQSITLSDVKFESVMCRTAFSTTFCSKMRGKDKLYAVKSMIMEPDISDSFIRDIVSVFAHYKAIFHPHIQQVYHFSTVPVVFVVHEYSVAKDLGYLIDRWSRKARMKVWPSGGSENTEKFLQPWYALIFPVAEHIASALAYLDRCNMRCPLVCPNLIIINEESSTAKIGVPEISKSTHDTIYAAPGAEKIALASSSDNVWAFGICILEAFALERMKSRMDVQSVVAQLKSNTNVAAIIPVIEACVAPRASRISPDMLYSKICEVTLSRHRQKLKATAKVPENIPSPRSSNFGFKKWGLRLRARATSRGGQGKRTPSPLL